jgi:hypothetical protein
MLLLPSIKKALASAAALMHTGHEEPAALGTAISLPDNQTFSCHGTHLMLHPVSVGPHSDEAALCQACCERQL